MNAATYLDMHCEALSAIAKTLAEIGPIGQERSFAVTRALAECLAAEYCAFRGIAYESECQAMAAAAAAFNGLKEWCDREFQTVNDGVESAK